jgi:hypothetical protein
MRFKLHNPFANDPFLKTTLVWGLGLLTMYMCLRWAMFQLDSFDTKVDGLLPFLLVILGTWYLIRFIGERPLFHGFLCGATVGFGYVTLGFLSDELAGLSYQGVLRYLLLIPAASVGLGLPGLLVSWLRTRGRTAITIELPDKKELEAAKREGRSEPAPRIVTPVSAMPGSIKTNTALLEQLEHNPVALMSERERSKLNKQAAKNKVGSTSKK